MSFADFIKTVTNPQVVASYKLTFTATLLAAVINAVFGFILAWQFWVGGYQPAQKYLKDRKGRTLSFQEIEHYKKMIAVLLETERLMKEIDRTI
ncbi:hypothetical protein FACS189419_09700 [Planctomycetales bacterium]|nr:hypothetical protein FACS189419_09700 [Planctomycetales bacterium]